MSIHGYLALIALFVGAALIGGVIGYGIAKHKYGGGRL